MIALKQLPNWIPQLFNPPPHNSKEVTLLESMITSFHNSNMSLITHI